MDLAEDRGQQLRGSIQFLMVKGGGDDTAPPGSREAADLAEDRGEQLHHLLLRAQRLLSALGFRVSDFGLGV